MRPSPFHANFAAIDIMHSIALTVATRHFVAFNQNSWKT
jgi:hypothetical protein